jgi:hypothetical protein
VIISLSFLPLHPTCRSVYSRSIELTFRKSFGSTAKYSFSLPQMLEKSLMDIRLPRPAARVELDTVNSFRFPPPHPSPEASEPSQGVLPVSTLPFSPF